MLFSYAQHDLAVFAYVRPIRKRDEKIINNLSTISGKGKELS